MADVDLDDEPLEDEDGSVEMVEHDDNDTITPEAERSEHIKSIMSGRLGGAYGIEDEVLDI